MRKYNFDLKMTAWLWALIATGCAGQANLPPPQALPVQWYQLNQTVSSNEQALPENPSAQADRHVQAVLDVHGEALEEARNPVTRLLEVPGQESFWEFDQFIAGFALSVDGILGSLLSAGTTAVRGVWTKVGVPGGQNTATTPVPDQKPAVLIPPGEAAKKLSARLEPSVQAALTSGRIQDENAFRKNLKQSALSFQTVCAALSEPGYDSDWHLDQYRLDLSFNASGQVSSVVGVGGAISIRLECQRAGSPPYLKHQATKKAQTPSDRLAREIASEIALAAAEVSGIEMSGYFLRQVRIGVGFSASGNLVIARGGGSAMGSMTFLRDRQPSRIMELSAPAGDSEWIEVANDAFSTRKLLRNDFRKGLARAMGMGSYFAEKAGKMQGKAWQLSNIETEFDLSVGGNLGVATVVGNGVVVLGFAWADQ